jgi:hypothetical protein
MRKKKSILFYWFDNPTASEKKTGGRENIQSEDMRTVIPESTDAKNTHFLFYENTAIQI